MDIVILLNTVTSANVRMDTKENIVQVWILQYSVQTWRCCVTFTFILCAIYKHVILRYIKILADKKKRINFITHVLSFTFTHSFKIFLVLSILDVDYCYDHQCQHGHCHALKDGYQCKCKDGYKGKYCQGKLPWNCYINWIYHHRYYQFDRRKSYSCSYFLRKFNVENLVFLRIFQYK